MWGLKCVFCGNAALTFVPHIVVTKNWLGLGHAALCAEVMIGLW